MKSINVYITEKFQVSTDNIRTYTYHPTTKDELIDCIKEKIEKEGFGTKDKPLDLNDIDTGEITEMNDLFNTYITDNKLIRLSRIGNFDISNWDVSNVENMGAMFYCSDFDGDLSNWDVSNVKDMSAMFARSAYSANNGDISGWDVSNVKDLSCMFDSSQFTGEKSDLSKWKIKRNAHTILMFDNCPLINAPIWWDDNKKQAKK